MTRIFCIAAVLTITTTVSSYAGCRAHTGPVMSCAEGSIWDSAAQACVPITSS